MLIKKINLMEVGNNLRALPKLDINLIKRILKSFLCNVLIPFISLLTCSFLNIQLRVTFGAKEERTDDRIPEEVEHTKLRAKVVSVIFTLIIEVIGAENQSQPVSTRGSKGSNTILTTSNAYLRFSIDSAFDCRCRHSNKPRLPVAQRVA